MYQKQITIQKPPIRALGLAAIVILIALVAFQAYRTSTPDYALEALDRAMEKGDPDAAKRYLTSTGHRILKYIIEEDVTPHPQETVQILHRRRVGDEYRIRMVASSFDFSEMTADFILVREGIRWQFDDMYCLTFDGLKVELMFSYTLDHPLRTVGILIWKNPGFAFENFLRGFMITSGW